MKDSQREWYRASARKNAIWGGVTAVAAVIGLLVTGDPFLVALVSCYSVAFSYDAWRHLTRSRLP